MLPCKGFICRISQIFRKANFSLNHNQIVNSNNNNIRNNKGRNNKRKTKRIFGIVGCHPQNVIITQS